MKVTKELYDKLSGMTRAMEIDGIEYHNPTPVAVPCGMGAPLTLQERIQRVLRTELSMQAGAQGNETWEEANDFDVDDDDFESPASIYEYREMAPDNPPQAPTPSPPINPDIKTDQDSQQNAGNGENEAPSTE